MFRGSRRRKVEPIPERVIYLKDVEAKPEMIAHARKVYLMSARNSFVLALLPLSVAILILYFLKSNGGLVFGQWVLLAAMLLFLFMGTYTGVRFRNTGTNLQSVRTRFAMSELGLHSQVLINDKYTSGGLLRWASLTSVEETPEEVRLVSASDFAYVKNEAFRSAEERGMLLQLANSRGQELPKDLKNGVES